jgi:hypothetical protein
VINCLAQMLAPVRGNRNVERLPRLGHVSDTVRKLAVLNSIT